MEKSVTFEINTDQDIEYIHYLDHQSETLSQEQIIPIIPEQDNPIIPEQDNPVILEQNDKSTQTDPYHKLEKRLDKMEKRIVLIVEQIEILLKNQDKIMEVVSGLSKDLQATKNKIVR